MSEDLNDSEYANRLRKRRLDLQKQIIHSENELGEVEKLLFELTGFLGQSARTPKREQGASL